MKNKLASIVSVTVLICAGLLMLTEAGASTATAPEEEWNVTFGGTDSDGVYSVQQTSDGGYIIAGYTESYGAVFKDILLIKTDSNGNKQWNRTFGGSAWDEAYSVQQTSDGGYIIAGRTDVYELGHAGVWLIKTDSDGNKVWDKTFGGIDSLDVAHSVQQTLDGGYIIAGYTKSYGVDGDRNVWLIKTNSKGKKQWDKTFGGDGGDLAYSVQQTGDGGYILAGETSSYGTGAYDFWLIKTDSDGNNVWDKTFGGLGNDAAYSVQQTSDGGYIIAGETSSHGIYNRGNYPWLMKTDSKGNEQWNKTIISFGEINSEKVSSVQTSDGGYIAAGTRTWAGFWLVKTDSKGTEQWSKTFRGKLSAAELMGPDIGAAYSVQQTSDGGYIIAGETGLYGAGDYDVWLIKLKGTDADTSPMVTAPDIEKPLEKSIPAFGSFGVMSAIFAVFLLMRRRA